MGSTLATFTTLPSGKTRVTIRKRGVYKGASFDKKSDAKAWALKIEAAIENDHRGVKRPVQHAQLRDLIDKFNEETPKRGTTTSEQREFWAKTFGTTPLKLIDLEFGRRVVKTYMDRGAQSPHAIKMLRGIARIVRWGRTVANLDISEEPLLQVAENMRYSGFAVRYRARKTIPTEDQVQLLIDHFATHERKAGMAELLEFLAASGMRVGEATRIVGSDVSMNRKTVLVRDRKHPTRKLGNHQEVPLIGRAWTLVEAKVRDGVTGRLFPVTNPSQRFAAAKTKLCLDLRLHDFRRHFVQTCYDAGLQPHIVAIATGHTELGTLMAHYSDLKADDFHKAVARTAT